MDGEAGWWTTSGNIGLPPLARAMGVGRQQQLSVDRICQEHEVMREADANETSGELGSAFGRTIVGLVPVENTIVRSVD